MLARYGCSALMCGLGAIAGEPCSIRVPSLPKITAQQFSWQRSTVAGGICGLALASDTLFFASAYYLLGASLCFCRCPSWDVQRLAAFRRRFGVACGVLRHGACNSFRFRATHLVSWPRSASLLHVLLGHAALGHAAVDTAVAVSWLQSVSPGFHALTLLCHSQRFRCCS